MPPVFCTNKKEDLTTKENEICEEFSHKRYYKGEYIPDSLYNDLTFIERLKEARQHALEEELDQAAATETQIYKPPAETSVTETQQKKPTDLTIPGYDFLGPGTDLDKKRHHVPRSKLDKAAKEHDLEYENPNVDTRTADKKFIKSALASGELLGIPAAAAIEAKHHIGLDKYFRPDPTKKPTGQVPSRLLPISSDNDSGIHMASEDGGSTTSLQGSTSGGSVSDAGGMVVGSPRPTATNVAPVTTTFTRTFFNAVKGTNMNDAEIVFTRTSQRALKDRPKLGDWSKSKKIRLANIPTTKMMEGVGTSQEYIIPYHCLGWIQNTQQEVLFANATHYRVESIGLQIYDIKVYEWTTINGEERFIKNDTLELDIYIDKGDYVGFGNLKTLTGIPNKGYTIANPTTFADCELPKFQYYYNMNYKHLQLCQNWRKVKV